MTDPYLDHLVYAVPDLAVGVAHVADLTGVEPVPGGRHPGGTANHLLGLGPTSYLEIIGPNPSGDPHDRPRTFGLDTLTAPRLVTWAIHPHDLDTTVRRAQQRGYDPGDVAPLSRRTPDGTLLSWRLTRPAQHGLVPFLIDWGRTAHPAGSGLPQLRLVSLTGSHPDPDAVRRDLAALGAHLDVTAGDQAALRAVLDTPRGTVSLT